MNNIQCPSEKAVINSVNTEYDNMSAQIQGLIYKTIILLKDFPLSRELSLTTTKLEESEMWFRKVVEKTRHEIISHTKS